MWQHTLLGSAMFDLAFYFAIYAFLGWLLESVYAWFDEGHLVNRGFLNGPFCPIYGFGAVLLIVLLHPWMDNLPLLFIGAAVLTSLLEYLTGYALEKLFQAKWWDYSSRRFNLQGFICLRFSLYWAIGAVLMLRCIQPEVGRLVGKITYQDGIPVIYGLILFLTADFIHTLRSVWELKSMLLQIRLLHMETRDRFEYLKETSAEALEEIVEDIRSRYEMVLDRASAGPQRLFKAFPALKAKRHEQLFKDIRDRWAQRHNG